MTADSPTVSRSNWLLRFPPRPAATVRLVCLPGAGSRASMFQPWSADLPSTVEVCGIQLPGRGGRLREPSFTRMEPLADAVSDALRAHRDLPMVIFGHSLGSLVAFEVTRRLLADAEHNVVALVVAAHKAPQLGSADTFGVPPHELGTRQLVEFVDGLGGTPSGALADPDIVRLMLPALRADLELDHSYTYVPKSPLTVPIHAFGGTADPLVSRSELVAWRDQTTSAFRLRQLPGDHFFLTGHSGPALLADIADIVRRHR